MPFAIVYRFINLKLYRNPNMDIYHYIVNTINGDNSILQFLLYMELFYFVYSCVTDLAEHLSVSFAAWYSKYSSALNVGAISFNVAAFGMAWIVEPALVVTHITFAFKLAIVYLILYAAGAFALQPLFKEVEKQPQ